MKILLIVDRNLSAIDRLAQLVGQHAPHHTIRIFPVHPKRNDSATFLKLEEFLNWADLVDVHYWKSGKVVKEQFPKLWESKPKILFHFNPYDLDKENWNADYQAIIVGNTQMQNASPYATLIPYGLDLSFFKFNEEYTENKVVNMVVGRIEKTKGVREVAHACADLGYQFRLVGRVSKPDYIQEVMAIGRGFITFIENASEDVLLDEYKKAAIHVCNSWDNFESGTLPMLEAMATGVPVLTRNVGHVPDLFNGKNMVVRDKKEYDIDDLKEKLKEMMENRDWRIKLREAAWDTVRTRDSRKMAWNIIKLYSRIWKPDRKLMSIIIPTRNNPECFTDCLVKAIQQDYGKFEIVIADSSNPPMEPIVQQARRHTDVPIKYIQFKAQHGEYTLAQARNRAVIEAEGEVLVFCDDRIGMEPNVLSEFARYGSPRTWLWGVKDGVMKGFVENFSCIARQDFIREGMFLERMQWYGGLSEETRKRYESYNNVNFEIVQTAKANQIKGAKKKKTRREQIIEAKFLIHKMYA